MPSLIKDHSSQLHSICAHCADPISYVYPEWTHDSGTDRVYCAGPGSTATPVWVPVR